MATLLMAVPPLEEVSENEPPVFSKFCTCVPLKLILVAAIPALPAERIMPDPLIKNPDRTLIVSEELLITDASDKIRLLLSIVKDPPISIVADLVEKKEAVTPNLPFSIKKLPATLSVPLRLASPDPCSKQFQVKFPNVWVRLPGIAFVTPVISQVELTLQLAVGILLPLRPCRYLPPLTNNRFVAVDVMLEFSCLYIAPVTVVILLVAL
ncbi:MAG TPA: hypothetical protein PKC69_08030 [Chitinophagaceae bacterium]|nr:hypothetical protein [Chitinophagaceae bacterium]